MLEPHRYRFLWCGLRQAASPFLEVSEQQLSPATWRGFFMRRSAQPTVRLGVRVVGLLSSGEIGKLCMARHDQLSPAPGGAFVWGRALVQPNRPAAPLIWCSDCWGAARPLGPFEEVAPPPAPTNFFFVQTAFNIAMLPRLREENTLGENTMTCLDGYRRIRSAALVEVPHLRQLGRYLAQ